MFKIYLFVSICNKTENKHKTNGINFNVILKRNLMRPQIQ